jgi:tetratricopeptide (TPR) repeat protein
MPVAGVAAGQERAPAGREQQRIDMAAYLRRGLEYAARPRPEDQQEGERLLRQAIKLATAPDGPAAGEDRRADLAAGEDRRADLAAAHAGIARLSAYLFALGLDETPARLRQAIESADRAVDLAPDLAAAHAARAFALIAADRLTPAAGAAATAVTLDPRAADGHLALAHVLRLRKEMDGALRAAGEAARLAPHDPRILTGLADALRDAGRHEDAMQMYGQAVELDHEAVAPQLGAAAALLKAGRSDMARAAYNLLLSRWDYGTERTRLAAAALLVLTEQWEAALAMYDQVNLPDNGALPTLLALYGKAWCLQRLARDPEAEYFLSLLVARVPRDYDGPARGREMLFSAYDDLIRFFASRDRDDRVEARLREAAARPLAPTRFARRLAGRLESRGAADEAAAALEAAIGGSDPAEDPLEIAQTAIDLARNRSRDGRRPIRPGSSAGRALAAVDDRLAGCTSGVAIYRLARARALAGDTDASLALLGRARDAGYLPAAVAAAEADFTRLRTDPRFRALVPPPAPGP